jgi:hypothetical protein
LTLSELISLRSWQRLSSVGMALCLITGVHAAHMAAPPVFLGLWINEILPEDLRHFESIKLPTKAMTVTVTRAGGAAVKRQRVGVKGNFSVAQVSDLLQAVVATDETYWNSRDPMVVDIIGDSRRTIVNTSWSGHQEGDLASYVYTLEDGKWHNLYRCCKKTP